MSTPLLTRLRSARRKDRSLDAFNRCPSVARVRRGKTSDVRALYDLNLVEIEELEERWQELTEALEVLTTERNKRS
jgi:hypothetical protein